MRFLLANHGVLVFHRTPELAVLIGGVVEEAAQAALNAIALGGPVEIAPDMRAAALQRAIARRPGDADRLSRCAPDPTGWPGRGGLAPAPGPTR